MKQRNSHIFLKNLEKWAQFSQEKAELVKDCQTTQTVSFTENSNKELNLTLSDETQSFPLYSNEGGLKEAKEWFASLEDLEGVSVLFVYGVGLGYYYQAVLDWLKGNEQRSLVFFEDNLAVIHRLFETNLGTQLLNDKQVFLTYFESIMQDDVEMDELFTIFTFLKFKVSALKSYATQKADTFKQLKAKIRYYLNYKECTAIEYINFGQHFFRNFYQNLLVLPDSYLGNGLFEKFKGVPAIICGAGPSVEKNWEVLSKLKDKAIVFAGGTSVNVLNAKNIQPHFGVQIDPNWFQMTRLIMNECYETPFFYRNRFYHKAFRLIHGNRLYLTGSGGYDISTWFEKELGIEGQNLPEGLNVVNFSLAIANALGCNPIIFVGVDLAYTDEKSYADGVISHPLHDRKQHFQTKTVNEELMIRDDVNGKPIYTLWKWIAESVWFARFSLSNPELTLINATEGGLGLPGITNRSLQEVANEFLKQEYDLSGWIHGEIQEHPMPATVKREKIEEAIKLIEESLQKCLNYCQSLALEFSIQTLKIKENPEADLDFNENVMSLFESLNQEIGFTYLLRVFSDMYIEAFSKKIELMRIQTEEDEHKANIRKAEMNAMRYQFLAETARVNLNIIKRSFKDALKAPVEVSQELPKDTLKKEEYSFQDGVIKIDDEELQIHIQETLPEGSITKHQRKHADGKPKTEWNWDQNFKVQGPFSFWNEKGTLLSKTWYVNGIKQGKARRYYAGGELNSIQGFKDGLEEGKQEFFYPKGQLKTLMHYQKGILHGDVKLYFPNGQLKRELHFDHGKRNGAERMWNASGQLMIEVFYKEDQPIGVAREWRENGMLSKEYAYDENSKRIYRKQWGHQGGEIHSEKLERLDYFDKVALQTEHLTNSLEGVINQVGRMVPEISEDKNIGLDKTFSADMQKDLETLQKNMDDLKKIGQQIMQESGIHSEDTKEQIWKTPTVKKEVEKQLGEAAARMGEEVQSLMRLLYDTTALMAQKLQDKDKEKDSDKEQKTKPPQS